MLPLSWQTFPAIDLILPVSYFATVGGRIGNVCRYAVRSELVDVGCQDFTV